MDVTHGRMRLRARVHHGPGRRVLRPRAPLPELAARSPLARDGYGLLAGSRGGLVEFAAWCRVAAVSPHSVVHLPDGMSGQRSVSGRSSCSGCSSRPAPERSGGDGMSGQRSVSGRSSCSGCSSRPAPERSGGDGRAWLPVWPDAPRERLDVVLARADAGLRPSAWKAWRAGLDAGRPATLHSPAPRPWREPGWDVPPRVRVAEHAATLFLTGTPRALFDLGDAVTAVTADVPKLRDVRRHGEALLLGLYGSLSGGLELDVLVRDDRYRRR